MSALAHLGANSNSPKQKPTLSRHQNAISASAGGDPYPTTNVVSLVFGLGRLYARTIICTDSLTQSRSSKVPGERMADRRQKPKVGLSGFLSVRALT
jgi:hypothetical protein